MSKCEKVLIIVITILFALGLSFNIGIISNPLIIVVILAPCIFALFAILMETTMDRSVVDVYSKQSLTKDIIATPIDVYTIRMEFGSKEKVYRMDRVICSFETHKTHKYSDDIEKAINEYDKTEARIHKILGV